MDEPTEAQIREFWEWCGFIFHDYIVYEYEHRDTRVEDPYWENPQGHEVLALPKLDINNLFKYAIPKLYQNGYYYEILQWNEGQHKAIINRRTAEWAETYSSFVNIDPTLALFWAIYSLIDKPALVQSHKED